MFDLLARRHVSECDVFHGWNHQSLYSLRRAKTVGARVLITRSSAHAVVQDRILREEFERFGSVYPASARRLIEKHVQEYLEADVIDVCSEFVLRTMLEEGIPREKLRLLPVGFNPQRFRPGPKPDNVFRVIFVGIIGIQKGVQYLLEAFHRLKLPNAELVLVGGMAPDSRLFLPKYAGTFRHVPFVVQQKLAALYHSASVFVLPSLQEGFGMVVAEAAASGLPVIISENVGAMIRDGQDGFVVPIRDPDALADRLVRLYEDEDLRQRMARSAHQYIQQFTWERYHTGLIAIYHELAQS
jgi:glycosyltransferase involved in cell wall biosynthesis